MPFILTAGLAGWVLYRGHEGITAQECGFAIVILCAIVAYVADKAKL